MTKAKNFIGLIAITATALSSIAPSVSYAQLGGRGGRPPLAEPGKPDQKPQPDPTKPAPQPQPPREPRPEQTKPVPQPQPQPPRQDPPRQEPPRGGNQPPFGGGGRPQPPFGGGNQQPPQTGGGGNQQPPRNGGGGGNGGSNPQFPGNGGGGNQQGPWGPRSPQQPPRNPNPRFPGGRPPVVIVPGGGPVGSPGNPGPRFPGNPGPGFPGNDRRDHRDGRWGRIDNRRPNQGNPNTYGGGWDGWRGGPRERYDWRNYNGRDFGDRYSRRRNPQWWDVVRAVFDFDPTVEYQGTITPTFSFSSFDEVKSISDIESGVKSVYFTVEDGNVDIDYVQIDFADGGEPEFVDFNEYDFGYDNARTFHAGESFTIDLPGWERTVRRITMKSKQSTYWDDADVSFWVNRR